MINNDEELKKDTVKLNSLYEKGCMAGDPYKCSFLSEKYENGDGVTVDYTKAMKLTKKFCELASDSECAKLKELEAKAKK